MALTSTIKETKGDLVKTFYINNPEPFCPPYEDMFAYLDDAVNELGKISIKKIEDKIMESINSQSERVIFKGIERIVIYKKLD